MLVFVVVAITNFMNLSDTKCQLSMGSYSCTTWKIFARHQW